MRELQTANAGIECSLRANIRISPIWWTMSGWRATFFQSRDGNVAVHHDCNGRLLLNRSGANIG